MVGKEERSWVARCVATGGLTRNQWMMNHAYCCFLQHFILLIVVEVILQCGSPSLGIRTIDSMTTVFKLSFVFCLFCLFFVGVLHLLLLPQMLFRMR